MKSAVALMEKSDWNWSDAGGWWVGTGVGPELSTHMKVDAAQVVQTGVSGPHNGEYLCHVPEIYINGALADGGDTRLQDAHVDPLREYLEVGNQVRNTGVIRGERKAYALVHTFAPGGVYGSGAGRSDAALLGPSRRAVLIMRITAGVGWQSLQESHCG